MSGNKDSDDNNNDSWPWNDPTLKSLKAEHDRLMSELRSTTAELDANISSTNPFSIFKKFVDSNLSGLSTAFKEFPSNVAEIKASMQRESERRREEELEISRRWTGSTDTPDYIQMELSRSSAEEREEAREATLLLLSEAQRRNGRVPQEKIRALFEDNEGMLGELDRLVNPMLAMGGAWFYMPETGDKLPVGQDKWRWLAPSPRWLSVDWFKRSPYSPVRLEAHEDLEDCGKNWRAAFEDLLDASLDKPMSSTEHVGQREPYGRPQSTYHGPGLEWMLSLQCRGVLPPLLPRFYNDGNWLRSRSSTLHQLCQTRPDLPWSHDHSLAWYNSIQKDFSDLMTEVATKSTADTEALPPDTRYPELETEQDLYDALEAARVSASSNTQTTNQSEEAQNQFFWEEFCRMYRELHENKDLLPTDEREAHRQAFIDLGRYLTDDPEYYPSTWDRARIAFVQKKVAEVELEQRQEEEYDNLLEMVSEKKRKEPVPVVQKKPDVLSALTTTRTTRSADGTVTTEVVLKKRFSDGTETTEESVHTSNEKLERQHQEQQQQEEEVEQPTKKGWFWT